MPSEPQDFGVIMQLLRSHAIVSGPQMEPRPIRRGHFIASQPASPRVDFTGEMVASFKNIWASGLSAAAPLNRRSLPTFSQPTKVRLAAINRSYDWMLDDDRPSIAAMPLS